MEYELPSKENYTIYSKSGCSYCVKAKQLLINESHEVIDCDDYLIEDKPAFLEFMKGIIGKEYKTFPMIFDKQGKFVGGFTELKACYRPSINDDFPDPFSS
jgi:glutaredoxin